MIRYENNLQGEKGTIKVLYIDDIIADDYEQEAQAWEMLNHNDFEYYNIIMFSYKNGITKKIK